MASLAPKTTILGFHNAAHLLRRTTYRINKALINAYALKTPQQALDDLFVFTNPQTSRPLNDTGQTYYNTFFETTSDINTNTSLNREREWWLHNALINSSIEYKLALWLHTLFVTSNVEFNAVHFYDHLELLRFHTKDSLKNLATRITRDNLMLFYLNNRNNKSSSPDQNYAREFLELFTILKGPQIGTGNYTNYTEHDVQQAARVFTGFTTTNTPRINNVDPITFIPRGIINISWHDSGSKTFSSAFGNTTILGRNTEAGIQEELEDFVSMVFNQPETAKNYCRRLYRYFVRRNITPAVETDIIAPLATTMTNNNYNIEPVVKELLCSQHFYDEDDSISGDQVIGALAKSYIDLSLQMLSIFDSIQPSYATNPSLINGFFLNRVLRPSTNTSFSIFAPQTVEGYTGYSNSPNFDKTWITTGTLRIRYLTTIDPLISGGFNRLNTSLFVRNSGHFTNPSDSDVLMQELYDLLFAVTPLGERDTYFRNELLGNLSKINWRNEWNTFINTNNESAVKIALDRVIKAMIKSPEYQIM